METAKLIDQLSQALGRPRPDQVPPTPSLAPVLQDRRQAQADQDLLATFIESAQGRGTEVQLCTKADLARTLHDLLAAEDPGPLVAPSQACLADWGLTQQGLGRTLITWEAGQDVMAYHDQAAQAPVSLSSALAGVADMGMVLQAASPDQPRSLSLLPPVHIGLLPASKIRLSIADALDLAKDAWQSSSQMLFVAGPSSTGDIENVIVLGVHGPVKEIILLVTDR